MNNCIKFFSLNTMIFSLLLLPGCEWGSSRKKESKETTTNNSSTPEPAKMAPVTGTAIISMNGMPIVTVESLQDEKEKIFKANPQLKSMLAFMPQDQFDRNLAEGLANQEIINRYIEENKIDKTADYQAELEEGEKTIKRMINAKYFGSAFPTTVSDKDIADFYEQNKNVMQEIIISRGGIRTYGVLFGSETDAKNFLNAVRSKNNDISAAARELNIEDKLKDFKLINDQSFDVEQPVRDAVLNAPVIPMAEVVKVNEGSFFVVAATEKEDPKYRPLDERMKAGLRQYLTKEKQAERFETEINSLKTKYNVTVNESYFGANSTNQEHELSLEDFENMPEDDSDMEKVQMEQFAA